MLRRDNEDFHSQFQSSVIVRLEILMLAKYFLKKSLRHVSHAVHSFRDKLSLTFLFFVITKAENVKSCINVFDWDVRVSSILRYSSNKSVSMFGLCRFSATVKRGGLWELQLRSTHAYPSSFASFYRSSSQVIVANLRSVLLSTCQDGKKVMDRQKKNKMQTL